MIEHIFDATEKKPSEKLDALPNVALPNAEQTAESKRLASNLPPNSAVRKFVESYDERLASRGLIPKTLAIKARCQTKETERSGK